MRSFVASAFFLSLPAIAADPAAIEEIRSTYQLAVERSKQEPDEWQVIVTRRIVPGVGEQTKKLEFFTRETDDGARRILERVVLSWKVGPLPMKTEMLFIDGALAFAHLVETSGTCHGSETRLYFERATLIRARTSPETDCSSPVGAQRDSNFTQAYRDLARSVQAEALERLAWWKRLEAL